MSNSIDSLDIVHGNVVKTFFKYSIPNVIALIAMSSSGLVDAIFIGQYAGSVQLAAVNIVFPMYTLLFGLGAMLTTGSAVRIGKYLGEKDKQMANAMFTKGVASVVLVALILSLICFNFNIFVSKTLGANEELLPYASKYLKIISLFFLFEIGSYALQVYIRIEGRPAFASFGVIAGTSSNIILNWYLIVKLGYGIQGAAYGTGIAYVISFSILITHFLSPKCNLLLTKNIGELKEIAIAAYNGLSELMGEASSGIITFILNWIMVMNFGTTGVAAFTTINYTIWAGGMLAYGVADSLVPLISVNYGALKYNRINKFAYLAGFTVFIIGLTIFLLLTVIPDKMIALFLPNRGSESFIIAMEFASYIRWTFFASGLCIILSAYFTAVHRPFESVMIASGRGLVLPVLFILVLPKFFGDIGIYTAIPLSDYIIVVIGIYLFKLNYSYINYGKKL